MLLSLPVALWALRRLDRSALTHGLPLLSQVRKHGLFACDSLTTRLLPTAATASLALASALASLALASALASLALASALASALAALSLERIRPNPMLGLAREDRGVDTDLPLGLSLPGVLTRSPPPALPAPFPRAAASPVSRSSSLEPSLAPPPLPRPPPAPSPPPLPPPPFAAFALARSWRCSCRRSFITESMANSIKTYLESKKLGDE